MRRVLEAQAGPSEVAEAQEVHSNQLQEVQTAAARVGLPALFAVSVATARLLASWGVRPDVLVGHSLGEYAAAVVSGALDLPDAARLVAARSAAMADAAGGGAMLAVALDEPQVTALLAEHPDVDLAVVNGPRACVLSGPAGAVAGLEAVLAEQFDAADGRDDLAVELGTGCEGAQGPAAVVGEEPEVPGRRGRDLGGELAGRVEETDVGVADRLALTQDAALDDGFLGGVDAGDAQAALGGTAHGVLPVLLERGWRGW